jgi:hypothetical protein
MNADRGKIERERPVSSSRIEVGAYNVDRRDANNADKELAGITMFQPTKNARTETRWPDKMSQCFRGKCDLEVCSPLPTFVQAKEMTSSE